MRARTWIWFAFTAGAATAIAAWAAVGREWTAVAGAMAAAVAAGAVFAAAAHRRIARSVASFERALAGGEIVEGGSGIRELDGVMASAMALARRLAGERRESEIRRREAEAAMGAMTEGVVILDADERVLAVNPAAREMLELGDAPFRGRLALEALRDAELHRLAQRALRTGEPVESCVERSSPRSRSFEVRVAPFSPTDQGRSGALIVLRDVSRLRALERVRRDFAANASHELRTPVTSLRGYAESLREMELPPEAARFAQTIARNAAQLEALIRDLLALAEIESDRERGATPAKEDLPVAAVFAAVEDAMGDAARARRMALRFRAPDGLRVRAIPAFLERALVNLVENAIRYSEPGAAVEVLAERTEDGGVAIHVKDQGVGIAPEHLDRIFERFYRVDRARSRRQGGTGLGLSIVRNAVEAQGGTVTATSRLGVGSVFTVRLPGG